MSEIRVNAVRYQYDDDQMGWCFFHDGGWSEVDSDDIEAFLDYLRTLQAENAELKQACAEACEYIRNANHQFALDNVLSLLSTGEAMYLDEYDGGQE